jgi:hypothetical protein
MLSISCSTIERLLAPRANVKAMHVLDPAEEGTQRGTAAQADVHVRRLERSERGDGAVLVQIGRDLAWIEIELHTLLLLRKGRTATASRQAAFRWA